MKILGVSEGHHDAGVCLVEDGHIISASHSERYSKIKNDKHLHASQLSLLWQVDKVSYYEKPVWKNLRRVYSGQGWKTVDIKYDVCYNHHLTHAAAGFLTSPFDDCNIIVADAIGEWDTVSVWRAGYHKGKPQFTKLKSWKYPFSLGLFYSAITRRIGLKPNEDEFITMAMAAYGQPIWVSELQTYLHSNCHRGLDHILPTARDEDLAASAQLIIEDELLKLVHTYCSHTNLVLMGGLALNCVANTKIFNTGKNIWIMPNPGDCGSSVGAAALAYGNKLNWIDPYLGYNIIRNINPKQVAKHLLKHSYCGIANGRAEFGPRALGNRSLIADPRLDIKDTVNNIKRRQKFRPFAPAILQEYADQYFEGPMNEYMQFVAKAKHDHGSVTHVDGTARVQVVSKDCRSVIRPILEEWYNLTGCPMLLNTSLNIKGQPIVNDESDALQFEQQYRVKVF